MSTTTRTSTVTPLPTAWRAPETPTVQGTLALHLGPRLEPPPVPSPTGRPGADVVPIDAKRRGALESWSWRYAQAVVEVVAGDRPVSQLVRWTVPVVHRDLTRRAHLVGSAGGHLPGQGRGRRPAVRAQVLGVRTSFLAPDVAEASIHVRYGARSRAIAARFEIRDARWQCTALEFA